MRTSPTSRACGGRRCYRRGGLSRLWSLVATRLAANKGKKYDLGQTVNDQLGLLTNGLHSGQCYARSHGLPKSHVQRSAILECAGHLSPHPRTYPAIVCGADATRATDGTRHKTTSQRYNDNLVLNRVME
jgi:hypothetical protein